MSREPTLPGLQVAFTLAADVTPDIPLPELAAASLDSPLLTLAPSETSADMRVEVQANSVYRFYPQGQAVAMAAFRIPFKRSQAVPRKVQRILEQIAAYRNLGQLTPPTDALSNALKVEFLQLVSPATRQTAPEVAPLASHHSGEKLLRAGEYLAIAVTNLTPTPLYVYTIVMEGREQKVSLVYPYQPDQPARLRPDETLLMGAGPKYLIQMALPEGETSSSDLFKLWVSGSSIQPGVMIMPPLGQRLDPPSDPYGTGSRLDRDLRRALLGKVGSTAFPPFVSDPWWTEQQQVRVQA
ncbi:MAG: hypothetical protein NW237_07420 [Cyanobacteriota bacterium]|nr:hypothetical protein [Cyanobacteriota bacterium]